MRVASLAGVVTGFLLCFTFGVCSNDSTSADIVWDKLHQKVNMEKIIYIKKKLIDKKIQRL